MHISPATEILSGAAGGALIALSSTALLLLKGRVSGMSGITAQALTTKLACPASWWRAAYLAGLLLAGRVFGVAADGTGEALKPAVLVVAGLLVGFGTRLGGGCTSGHGVMGLPRLSPRSLVAVPAFMTAAAVAAALSRPGAHALARPLWASPAVGGGGGGTGANALALAVAPTLAAALLLRAASGGPSAAAALPTSAAVARAAPGMLAAFGCAFTFGAGLVVSGMTSTARVRGFLDFSSPDGWDLTLAGVMGAAVAINFVTFRLLRAFFPAPILAPAKSMKGAVVLDHAGPTAPRVDARLLVGSLVFGTGWGLAGICPGPAIVSLSVGTTTAAVAPAAAFFVPAMLVGMLAESAWQQRQAGRGNDGATAAVCVCVDPLSGSPCN